MGPRRFFLMTLTMLVHVHVLRAQLKCSDNLFVGFPQITKAALSH